MPKKLLEVEADKICGEQRIVLGKIGKKLFIGVYCSETCEIIYEDLFKKTYKRSLENYWKTLDYQTRLKTIRDLDEIERKNRENLARLYN